MLRQLGRAVPKEPRHNFQPDSPVQAAGCVGVTSHMAEDGLVDPADVANDLQVGIDLLIGNHRKAEIVFPEDIHAVFKNHGGEVDSGLVPSVVDVILTVWCLLIILGSELGHVAVAEP